MEDFNHKNTRKQRNRDPSTPSEYRIEISRNRVKHGKAYVRTKTLLQGTCQAQIYLDLESCRHQ